MSYKYSYCNSLKEIVVHLGQKARFIQMGLEDYANIIVERDNEELTILLNLAKAYELGIGVPKSVAQAALTYSQAAEKGSAEAAYKLAEWYANGDVLPKDLNKALEMYERAAKTLYKDAKSKAQNIKQAIEEESQRQEAQMQEYMEELMNSRQHSAEQTSSVNAAKVKFIFFDTEATGLPRFYNAPMTDTGNWPRLVQLAWITTDEQGNVIKRKSEIIRPDGFYIPLESTNIHGITQQQALNNGKPMRDVLQEFMQDLNASERMVGHNISFDRNVVGAELCRLGLSCDSLRKMPFTCTMEASTDFCAIPSNSMKSKYMFPRLDELYCKLFGRTFANAHDALADITATKECYFELRKRGVISQ